MAKIIRKNQKIFGLNATTGQMKQFGSLAAGTPINATDVEIIQALSQFTDGWYAAVMGGNSPAIQDRNALDHVLSYQLAYLMQAGVAEWDDATTYYIGSLVNDAGTLYFSLQDNNLNHGVSDDAWWTPLISVEEGNGLVLNDGVLSLERPTEDTKMMRWIATRQWQDQNTPQDSTWKDIAWAASIGLFAAVSMDGTNRVMTSPDGIAWTLRSAAAANGWNSIAWSPSLHLFVAVSLDGTDRVMTSPDGITWTSRTCPSLQFQRVIWVSKLNLFVAVGFNAVMTSADGITWTSRTPASSRDWRGLCYSEELSLLVASGSTGDANRIMTSPDGITWTGRAAITEDFYTIDWASGPGLFISPDSGGSTYITSPDGITWTQRNLPGTSADCVVYSSDFDLIVVLGSAGTSSGAWVSADGINWKTCVTPTGFVAQAVCWAKELGMFVGVRSSVAGKRVVTSR